MTTTPLTSHAEVTIGRTETGSVRMVVTDSSVPSRPTVTLTFNSSGAKWVAAELLRAAEDEKQPADTSPPQAIDIRCPTCLAKPGTECRDENGEATAHQAREDATKEP